MAAIIATIKGKVLIQIEGSEPVEVGEVEIPIHVSTKHESAKRGREIASPHVEIQTFSD
jgi:hypothetical protein